MDWFNENVLARGARLLGVGLWKGGDEAVIDGAMVNGSARGGGLDRRRGALVPDRLHLPLRLRDDRGRVRADDVISSAGRCWSSGSNDKAGEEQKWDCLSLAIWTPIFFGVVLLALGRDDQARAVRWLALIGAIVSLLVTLPLYAGFDTGTSAMQFVEKAPLDRPLQRQLPPRHRRHLVLVRAAHRLHQPGGGHLGLGSRSPNASTSTWARS